MKLICYSIKHMKPTQRTKFQRELYGFKDISNHGKYTYQRKGLMNSIKHKTIFFTGLLIGDKDAKQVIKLLQKHNAKIHVTDTGKSH